MGTSQDESEVPTWEEHQTQCFRGFPLLPTVHDHGEKPGSSSNLGIQIGRVRYWLISHEHGFILEGSNYDLHSASSSAFPLRCSDPSPLHGSTTAAEEVLCLFDGLLDLTDPLLPCEEAFPPIDDPLSTT